MIAGLTLTVIAAAGYVIFDDVTLFILMRVLHGLGFGISLTCSTAISNEYVPASRLSEGVGFTSSANTIANAIGPTIALEILGNDYSNFIGLFLVLLLISSIILFLSVFVKGSKFENIQSEEKQSYKGIIIAVVFFLTTFSQGAVNSYLTSYARIQRFEYVGLFFTMTAIVTFVSRFYSGKLQERFGIQKLSFVYSMILALSIAGISFIKSGLHLLLLAVPYGLAAGLLFPIFNYRIIKTVLPSQFAFGTSVYYCGLDIRYGIGSIVWGYVSSHLGFQSVFIIAGIMIVFMAFIDQFVYKTLKI